MLLGLRSHMASAIDKWRYLTLVRRIFIQARCSVHGHLICYRVLLALLFVDEKSILIVYLLEHSLGVRCGLRELICIEAFV